MKIQHVTKTKFEIPALGLVTDEHGVVEVSDDIAGRPADPRLDELMAAHAAEEDHAERARIKEEFIGLEKGTGLLMQDVWKPYGKKAATAASKEDDK